MSRVLPPNHPVPAPLPGREHRDRTGHPRTPTGTTPSRALTRHRARQLTSAHITDRTIPGRDRRSRSNGQAGISATPNETVAEDEVRGRSAGVGDFFVTLAFGSRSGGRGERPAGASAAPPLF